MSINRTFTSESVSEGHPDKMADQISDAILDAIIAEDKEARVACETMVKTGMVIIAGEITTSAWIDLEELCREVILDIGYDSSDVGFDGASCAIINAIGKQSPDIAMGVDDSANHEQGAGDQGLMFGYACRETEELMPAPIHFSHQILKELAAHRKADANTLFGPDAKSQVTLRYNEDGSIAGVDKLVLSTQHKPGVSTDDIRAIVTPLVAEILPKGWMVDAEDFLINPTGKFEIGGPDGDAGLTGRKIIVDTYGGAAPHGGGAFSGKDPTKVDRSAAYAARYLAKNIVAAGLADKCTIQIAYAIGVAAPVSVYVNTHGSTRVDDAKLSALLTSNEVMDLTPRGIRTHLGLNQPIYTPTAAYGHFGRRAGEAGAGTFSWEALDLTDNLLAAL